MNDTINKSPFGYPMHDPRTEGNYGAIQSPVGYNDVMNSQNFYYQNANVPESFEFGGKSGPQRPSQRKMMNIHAVFVALFVPIAIFTGLFLLISSKIRYHHVGLTSGIIMACFVLVLWFGITAVRTIRKKAHGAGGGPTWLIFVFLSSLVAWVVAVSISEWNFDTNLQPAYLLQGMGTYTAVDPAYASGKEMMDAGRIIFTNNSKLDVSKSIGFKGVNMYCAAPVAPVGVELAGYDFWAVGKDCCSSAAANFHCGDSHNPNVHAGMRYLRDEDTPYFRLAVQQAEAAYGIKAAHPLFIEWTLDPIDDVDKLYDDGMYYCYYSVLCAFVFQLANVICAAFVFDKYR